MTEHDAPDTAEGFDRFVAQLDNAVFVVTVQAPTGPSGCLVGFATQISISPRRFLVGLSKKNHTYRAAQRSTALGVHLISRRHARLAHLFGEETGDHIDKFGCCSWRVGPEGVPILQEATDWFVGTVLERYDAGDHVAHLLSPVAVRSSSGPAEPGVDLLTFQDVKTFTAGHQ